MRARKPGLSATRQISTPMEIPDKRVVFTLFVEQEDRRGGGKVLFFS
jgi:hypothetical protein